MCALGRGGGGGGGGVMVIVRHISCVHGACVRVYLCVNIHAHVRVCVCVCVCVCVYQVLPSLGAGVTAVGSRDGYPDAVSPFSALCPHPLTEVW